MDEPQAPLTEREQFEAWYAPRFAGGEPANMPLRPNGEYVSAQQHIAWLAWQARAALSTAPVLLQDEAEGRALSKALASKPDARLHAREAAAALASAPHPPSNTLGDAFGPGDPVASLPTPPIAAGDVRSGE